MMNNVSIPQAVWIACNIPFQNENAGTHGFQYRKRYGLHAIRQKYHSNRGGLRFNTASGMDCMQFAGAVFVGVLF